MGSTRLPGKPLADIAGKPMVVRVLEGLAGSVDSAVAATDDKRVADAVERAGFEAVMTGEASSGTARVFMAWELLGRPGDVILNVQGDEPLVCGSWTAPLLETVPPDDRVLTLARRVRVREASGADTVKVAVTGKGEALYFSRFPVPHGSREVLEHIGIYAFSPCSLQACARCGETELSRTERLEQLAWMEYGVRITVLAGDFHGIGVDTPEDLRRVAEVFGSRREGIPGG
ncbi:MAG: hypothetical protein AVO35_03395 [Candidatus Aegiribacteria sp. MLS_C]|nr:MAG: hypothetical protein AVO35_03395 [Candidatus Aegiribacteria sp. MLS_C]